MPRLYADDLAQLIFVWLSREAPAVLEALLACPCEVSAITSSARDFGFGSGAGDPDGHIDS
jgi:hypothetical protein